MIKQLVILLACVGLAGISHADPLDKTPRIKRLVEITAPEIYEVKITLEDGKVVELEKVALTERSLQRRFSLNSVDKTMRVLPKGEDERITLNVGEIEKIEITKIEPEDKPEPKPNNDDKTPVYKGEFILGYYTTYQEVDGGWIIGGQFVPRS